MFQFPAAPVLNQTFTPIPGVTYVFNGTGWALQGVAFIPLSQKGAALGVPDLDATGKVPAAQLPAVVAGITLRPLQNALTTFVDFLLIPSGVKRITVTGSGISGNGASQVLIQIGKAAGGVEIVGYQDGLANTLGGTGGLFTTGFGFMNPGGAANVGTGVAVLNLVDAATFKWGFSSAAHRHADAESWLGSGTKSLAGELDRVRITWFNGTDVFDAGNFGLSYE